MHESLYESLLTERLHQALAARPDLEIESVDEGEQPLTIARHLMPVIERSLRAAATPQNRADLVYRILAAPPDPDAMVEALHRDEPGTIQRLEEVRTTNGSAARQVVANADVRVSPGADHRP